MNYDRLILQMGLFKLKILIRFTTITKILNTF